MTEPQRCVTGHGTLTLEGLADSVSGYLDLPREFRCLTDRRFAPPLVNAEPLGLVNICVGLDPAHAERPIVHIHLFPSDGIESFEPPAAHVRSITYAPTRVGSGHAAGRADTSAPDTTEINKRANRLPWYPISESLELDQSGSEGHVRTLPPSRLGTRDESPAGSCQSGSLVHPAHERAMCRLLRQCRYSQS